VAEEFAVVDSGEHFGGGNLTQYYGIRSNTSAAGFLKVIQYPKSSAEKAIKGDDSGGTARVIPVFNANVANGELANFLRATGKTITSLQVVGLFLTHVGFQMLLEMHLRYHGR
jgi:hypothetical protein